MKGSIRPVVGRAPRRRSRPRSVGGGRGVQRDLLDDPAAPEALIADGRKRLEGAETASWFPLNRTGIVRLAPDGSWWETSISDVHTLPTPKAAAGDFWPARSPDALRAIEARANQGFTVASPALVCCATRIVVGTKTSALTLSI